MEQQPHGGTEGARPPAKGTPDADAPDTRPPGADAGAGGSRGEVRTPVADGGGPRGEAPAPGADMPDLPPSARAAVDPAVDPAPDLAEVDLETLRTVEHPVLAALVDDLRVRVAAPGSEALWGFDNSM